MTDRPLDGKVALITGAAGGLGAATARACAAAGAQLVLSDVDAAGLEAIASALDAHHTVADVSSLQANRDLVASAVEAAGRLDLVHLNAGVMSGIGLGDEFDETRYRAIMGVNLDGVVFGTVAARPVLRDHGGGAIVATASLAGLTAVPMDPLYSANKHAVVGLARSLGPGLALEGIRFNAVCPGYAESAMVHSFRQSLVDAGIPIIPAEQVADTVVTLFAGDMSGECWFVQAGRESAPFAFRGLPGPRQPEESTTA